MWKYSQNIPLTSASVTTSLSTIRSRNITTAVVKGAIVIPVHALTGYLYLYASVSGKQADNSTAIDATFVQNYGTRWESADKVAVLLIDDNTTVYGVTSTGTFTAYPTEWY